MKTLFYRFFQSYLLLCVVNLKTLSALPNGLPPRATVGVVTCDDGVTTGYKSYSSLEHKISNGSQSAKATFVLCPGFYWNLHGAQSSYQKLRMYDGMAIICGEDGKSSNDCTFARSPDHMFVQHANGSDMVVMGIKFIDAWSMSIRTSLNQNRENTLTFIDCHWKNNSGVYFNLSRSTIYVYMHVILKHCTFEDNRPSQDLIKVQSSGKATLIDCVFKSNRASRTIVLVNDGGSVSLTRVCFLNNIGITAYGTVASMHTDGLETSENTYFADNDMRIGCSNGFSVVTPTTSTCDEPSITNACIAEDIGGEFFIPLPTSAPSKVPSTSPSSLPTVTPSVTPTMIPSVSPSLTPSSKPSFAPTNKPSDTPTVIPSISHSPSAEKSDEPTQIPSISHAPSSDTKINSNSLETSDALKKYSSAAGFWYSAFFITLLLCA